MKTLEKEGKIVRYLLSSTDGGVDYCFTKIEEDGELSRIESYKNNECIVAHALGAGKELIVQGGTLTINQPMEVKGSIKVLSGATLYLNNELSVGYVKGDLADESAACLFELYDGATLVIDSTTFKALNESNIIIHKYAIVIFKNTLPKFKIEVGATTTFNGKYKDVNNVINSDWTNATYFNIDGVYTDPKISFYDYTRITVMTGSFISFNDSNITFSSISNSDPTIATISNDGKLTALDEGVTTLTYMGNSIEVIVYESLEAIKQEYLSNGTQSTAQFIKMSDNETIVTSNCFGGNSNNGLKQLITSKNLTTIEDSAFNGLYYLEKIYLYDKLESIGAMAFNYCGQYGSGFKLIINSTTVPNCSSYTFMNANIECVYVPDAAIDAFTQDGYFGAFPIRSINDVDKVFDEVFN